jgi:anion-transporting  ArsA/GET3 family ATPase
MQAFSGFINHPVLRLDEVVSLINTIDNESDDKYGVVVVDTTLASHTLCLSTLPQFLDALREAN